MSKHFPPWQFDEPNPVEEKKLKDKVAMQMRKNGSSAYWHKDPNRICWNCKTTLVLCTGDCWCMCENCGEDCGLE